MTAAAGRDEIDLARSDEYALLASLLLRAPDSAILARLSRLEGTETPLGASHIALAEAAHSVSVETVEREYFDLFLGVGRGELRSEEHTSELQSLMRISYAVFCLKKKKQ